MNQKFHLSEILTLLSGVNVSVTNMEGMRKMMAFMTGEPLWNMASINLVMFKDVCVKSILTQHPEFSSVDGSGVDRGNWESWLCEQIAKHGEQIELHPIPKNTEQAEAVMAK